MQWSALAWASSAGLVGEAEAFSLVALAMLAAGLFLSTAGKDPGGDWGTSPACGDAPPRGNLEAACRRLATEYLVSEREFDVLVLLAAGKTKGPIAERLSISPQTAKTHIASIYRKLGVHSQQELIETVEGEVGRR